MSVIVIKSETTEYRILVKAGGEELARKEAVKAAISAEAARISAIEAGDSEQVATEKAAQSLEDAAAALASKEAAEAAKLAAQDSEDVSTEQALISTSKADISTNKATESAASAEAARLSAIAAGIAEQVATEKASQTVEDAASALASKNEAAAILANALTKRGAVNAQIGTTYTLVISDEYLEGLTMDNAAANTITIPTNAVVNFPIGTKILITQLGAGGTTIAAAAGVNTIVPESSPLLINAIGESRFIEKRAINTWLII